MSIKKVCFQLSKISVPLDIIAVTALAFYNVFKGKIVFVGMGVLTSLNEDLFEERRGRAGEYIVILSDNYRCLYR